MNEIHQKCNGSRYWSSNFKTSESGSSKDLVGLKGNYPYPKNTPQLLECVLGVGFLGVRSAGFAVVFFFSNWFREGSSMFFSTLDRDSGSGVPLDRNPTKGEVRECMGLRIRCPPQKKNKRKSFWTPKTACYTKELLHLKSCCFYIKSIYNNRKPFIYTRD